MLRLYQPGCQYDLGIRRITPLSNTSSRWTADFAIEYVEKTNVLLRKTIESGEPSCG